MFWYAIDKIKSIECGVSLILVQPHMQDNVRRLLPDVRILPETKIGAALRCYSERLLSGSRGRAKIVSFTPHPLPFLNHQTIAFYDDFPFKGALGKIKLVLFLIGAHSSRCRIGVINRSLSLPFLRRFAIPTARIFFDSAFPTTSDIPICRINSTPPSNLIIGLVGTDSAKKNYGDVFTETLSRGYESCLVFLMYGRDNQYVQNLRDQFPRIRFEVVDSDRTMMTEFFGRVDYLISAATNEGYGRPMGMAAVLGVPMFLIRSPVFLEFFGDYATFFNDIGSMLSHLVNQRPMIAACPAQTESNGALRSPFFD